jgi:MFS family permease
MPNAEAVTEPGAAEEWKPTRRFLLAMMSLLTIVSAVAIDSTSLPAALPIMSADLGGTALQAFWAGTSFLLASTVIQPTVASMSHILGRKMVCPSAMWSEWTGIR